MHPALIFLLFSISAIITIFASIKLTHYADAITNHTSLSHSLVGLILLSASTSLPELFSSSSASLIGSPDLAFGNIFGSNMTNIFILVLLDLFIKKSSILSFAHKSNVMTGVIVLLNTSWILFMILLSSFPAFQKQNFWFFSPMILITYIFSMKIIYSYSKYDTPKINLPHNHPNKEPSSQMSKKKAFSGFIFASVFVFISAILLTYASSFISQMKIDNKQIGETFVGSLLMALTTSLPEVVVSISAIQMKRYHLALGNIFGSNLFNLLILGVADLFYQISPLFLYEPHLYPSAIQVISKNHLISGFMSMIFIAISLVSIIKKNTNKIFRLGLDTFSIALLYLFGFYLLFILR